VELVKFDVTGPMDDIIAAIGANVCAHPSRRRYLISGHHMHHTVSDTTS
jgi:hypothetical protein